MPNQISYRWERLKLHLVQCLPLGKSRVLTLFQESPEPSLIIRYQDGYHRQHYHMCSGQCQQSLLHEVPSFSQQHLQGFKKSVATLTGHETNLTIQWPLAREFELGCNQFCAESMKIESQCLPFFAGEDPSGERGFSKCGKRGKTTNEKR